MVLRLVGVVKIFLAIPQLLTLHKYKGVIHEYEGVTRIIEFLL